MEFTADRRPRRHYHHHQHDHQHLQQQQQQRQRHHQHQQLRHHHRDTLDDILHSPPKFYSADSNMDKQPATIQTIKQQQQQDHILFELSPLDCRDEIDERTQKTYFNLKQMIANKTTKECHDIYSKYINSNVQKNTEELTMGLLVAILVESPENGMQQQQQPQQQQQQPCKYYRDVVSFSKDSLSLFSTYLNIIIIDKLTKLREPSVKQIFWITNQLMKANINTAENICSNLIRQTAGGDLSSKNVLLVENLLELVSENRNWLCNSTGFMVPTIIYTFMRLIADHQAQQQLAALRQREIDFVIGLIREKFLDCLQIGRDFLRLLHNIVKVPEFDKLWQDIFNDPKALHSTFQSSMQILSNRTPRRLFQSRLTFEMEKKISFLATQVKFGNQKRYQDWFHKQYLASPESLSLRCDLIRYICTIIHPTNEVLCSDIIPRWAIIGWLLTTCTTGASAINSKLALFFDWLVFDTKMDNIMNIEPGILVMYYSMRSHPNVTVSLLDFLCRIPTIFSPKLSEHIKTGIKKSLHQILEKRVVPSLAPLFDNPKHDPALKSLIREHFIEFCAHPPPLITAPLTGPMMDNGIAHNLPAQANHPNVIATNNINSKQIPEVIVIDQDKTTVTRLTATTTTTSPVITTPTTNLTSAPIAQLAPSSATSTPTVITSAASIASSTNNNPTAPTVTPMAANNTITNTTTQADIQNEPLASGVSKSQTNSDNSHIVSRIGDQLTNQSDIKIGDQICPSSSVVATNKDEAKVFSWNGTENANASYSHKQNHDSTKGQAKSSSLYFAGMDTCNNLSTAQSLPTANKLDITEDSTSTLFNKEDDSNIKVIYPFMTVPKLDLKEAIDSFDEPIRCILEDLNEESSNEIRCSLMEKLISTVFDKSDQSTQSIKLKDLGHCVANMIVDDFTTKIFPSASQDNESLEESIATPLFVLCRSAFSKDFESAHPMSPIALLASLFKVFKATGFLVLYYLKVNSILNGGTVSNFYIDFCGQAVRKKSKCLTEDLQMLAVYDPEMFCFLIQTVYCEIALSGSFPISGNVELTRLTVSTIDPVTLQELICLCLTCSAKVTSRESVMTLIEASLEWESWEQFCVWKLISAQGIQADCYTHILPKLDPKEHAEAMSCIMLNLQRVAEPTSQMVLHVIECDPKMNSPFVSSILRYWSMKTDVGALAKAIASLSDSRPPSPPVKRKGQAKAASKNSSTLTSRSERILIHLDTIRIRAPKNKLLAQTEILELLTQTESLCNESQRKRFADLFSFRPKANKKQKKMDKELTA